MKKIIPRTLPFAEVSAHLGDLCVVAGGTHPTLCFIEDDSDSSFFCWRGDVISSGDVVVPINFFRTKIKCITKNGIFYLSKRTVVKKVR